jgi:CHAD domain-containing protein
MRLDDEPFSPPGGLAGLAGEVADGIERAHDGMDAGALHDFRVSMARLMAALRLLEHGRSERPLKKLRHDVRWLRRRCGAARDLDVFDTDPAMRSGGQASAQLETAVAQARLQARDVISHAVRSRRCHGLLAALRRLELDRHAALPPSAKAAGQYVERQLRRVRRESRHPDQLGPRRLHRLRGHVRSLRYACEFLAPALPGYAGYIHPLGALQKTLGTLNDSFMIQLRARQALGGNEVLRLLALDRHHGAEVRRLRRQLRHELQDLRQLAPASPPPDEGGAIHVPVD